MSSQVQVFTENISDVYQVLVWKVRATITGTMTCIQCLEHFIKGNNQLYPCKHYVTC